jgi:hypothetical protein
LEPHKSKNFFISHTCLFATRAPIAQSALAKPQTYQPTELPPHSPSPAIVCQQQSPCLYEPYCDSRLPRSYVSSNLPLLILIVPTALLLWSFIPQSKVILKVSGIPLPFLERYQRCALYQCLPVSPRPRRLCASQFSLRSSGLTLSVITP